MHSKIAPTSPSGSRINRPLIIIGAGNMGAAIARGILQAEILGPSDLTLIDPDPAKLAPFAPLGVRVPSSVEEASILPDHAVLLAVKPQMFAGLATVLKPQLRPSHVVISIMAGTPIHRLRAQLGVTSVIRAMPNLPASIGQGATAIAFSPDCPADQRAMAEAIFRAVGPMVTGLDESLIDAFTAVAGSGPAYLFYLGEALTRAAMDQGIPEAAARQIARQTLIGSAAMLANDDRSFEALRSAVTSKGGTTEAACNHLDASKVQPTFVAAIAAGVARAKVLAST